MAESTQIFFTHKEVVTALLKEQGIHEGIWGLAVNFGFGAANMGSAPEASDLNPTALIPVVKLGIQIAPEINNLSVDAAVENPKKEK